ncbi:MAG: tetratricopeptide repeat protein [Thermomicrobiales bacterium]
MPDYYDLGPHSRPVSTSSADAQLWFDRGLNWTYAFNHEEAIRCYERALEHDPDCAMARWGIAYAIGPNYNKQWEAFDEADLKASLSRAYEESVRAASLIDDATPAERALILALKARYPSPEPLEDCSPWNDAYADAMREVYRQHGEDLDIAALFAEALMNRTPWQLWDLDTGEPMEGADTLEAQAVLERALETIAARTHPAVLHMYIHLMEMSPFPEKALRACDWLRGLVPDGGHLEHMPTHIDVLCGHYQNVVKYNTDAIVADRKYVEREGALNFYSTYRAHDYHFKLYGAMFLGNYEEAIGAANELIATTPAELLRIESPPMADWLEAFVPMNMHVYIRFGKWQEIIDTPLPDDQELLRDDGPDPLRQGRRLRRDGLGRGGGTAEGAVRAGGQPGAGDPLPFNNTALDILAIAAEMLYGELEYRKGNFEDAFAHLRKSIELDDGLPYDEPWGWMQPTRHAYGALLLEQGRVEDAAAVYRADLGLDGTIGRAFQHPENVWSLHGYHECLMRLGKHDMAAMIKQRLDLAIARADVPIHASCFCRLNHAV